MATFHVSAVKRIYLDTTVEAETREEAVRIAENELTTDDFEETNTDFTLTHVSF